MKPRFWTWTRCGPASPSARRAWVETPRMTLSPTTTGSRPPRGGRGLKHTIFAKPGRTIGSPSARRAWVETIERNRLALLRGSSRPPRGGRGLKHGYDVLVVLPPGRRPPRGGRGLKHRPASRNCTWPPTRRPPRGGRGLKLATLAGIGVGFGRPPRGGRGLKHPQLRDPGHGDPVALREEGVG